MFNDSSCANCHLLAAIGGGGTLLETRFGRTPTDGTFDPMAEFGGSLIQKFGIGLAGDCDYVPEIVPADGDHPRATAGRRRSSGWASWTRCPTRRSTRWPPSSSTSRTTPPAS